MPSSTSLLHLPEELLLTIFYTHVWDNYDTPLRLLRVCKRFHSIVINASSLWGDLLFTDLDHRGLEEFIFRKGRVEFRNRIVCKSVEALTGAIERTRSSKFELAIILNHHHPITHDYSKLQAEFFSSKCRALHFLQGPLNSFVNRLYDLSVLERLEIYGWISAIIGFLDMVHRTSHRLWYLRFLPVSPSTTKSYQQLMPRIRFLSIEGWFGYYILIAPHATKLESLQFYGASERTLGHLPDRLLPLATEGSEAYELPQLHAETIAPTFRGLRQLHIGNWMHPDRVTLEFPQLSKLTISVNLSLVSKIQAPNLKTLHLSGSLNSEMPPPTIHPKRLEIDVFVSEPKIIQQLALWRDLEDLQIFYKKKNASLWRLLADALAGTEKQERVCPKLWRLVILSSHRPSYNKQDSEDRLRNIVRAREGEGILKVAKYGWYKWTSRLPLFSEVPITWTHILGG